jgi:hypothetical protein
MPSSLVLVPAMMQVRTKQASALPVCHSHNLPAVGLVPPMLEKVQGVCFPQCQSSSHFV